MTSKILTNSVLHAIFDELLKIVNMSTTVPPSNFVSYGTVQVTH